MKVDVIMPRLGQEMERGTITEWYKQEGNLVNKGEVLFQVETGKATMDVDAEVTGVLAKILVAENVEVPVGQVVAMIETKE